MDFKKLKSITTNFDSYLSIDYRDFEYKGLLDFADGYYEGLEEIEKKIIDAEMSLERLLQICKEVGLKGFGGDEELFN